MINMFIGNEEVVSKNNFTIKEEMLSASSTILNNCYPKSWELDHDYITRFYYPKDYSKCVIKKNDELIFAGIVKNTADISLNPRYPKYCSLEILDFKTLLSEGNCLDFVINNKTVIEAITMVVNAISSYGFILGNINILNGNDIIGTYSTDNMTAYDVFQYLADISGSKWRCRQVDENTMAIDFYDPTLMPRGKQIEYTTEWAEENDLVDLSFNFGSRDYRNKQIILSDNVGADIEYTETKIADSYTTTFILENNIDSIISVYVSGEEKSVATNLEQDIGVYADFYYTPGKNELISNESNQPIQEGNVIEINYIALIKGREVVVNDDEITRLHTQLGVNGTIARYEQRNDETDSNKLLAIGETYLRYKGEAEINLTLKTKDTDLYEVGQIVYFTAPIQALSKDYMVKSKEINIIATGDDMYNVFYTYTLSSSFNAEREVNWFDNQRQKNNGNINEGEYISRNIDITNTATIIWNNVQVEETGQHTTHNNKLDTKIESPFNT